MTGLYRTRAGNEEPRNRQNRSNHRVTSKRLSIANPVISKFSFEVRAHNAAQARWSRRQLVLKLVIEVQVFGGQSIENLTPKTSTIEACLRLKRRNDL